MKRKRTSRQTNRFSIQKLEDRKLLAADLGMVDAFFPADVEPPQIQQQTSRDANRGPSETKHRNQSSPDQQRGPRNGHSDPIRNGGDEFNLLEIEAREIDGIGNNQTDPTLGSTDIQLIRTTAIEYGDGISDPAGADRPSAREISNDVVAQTTTETNDRNLTDLTWLWGQFIDHDIDLSEGADPAESFDIDVPTGDAYFDPLGTGEEVISLNRSTYDPETGTSADNPREQINQITAFLDGSVVYGSDEVRAAELRTFEGGLLKTSEGELLPFNEAGLDNAGGPSDTLFLAGDVRANENIALTAMHTIWVREHNSIATEIAANDPSLNDEQIYQAAKAIVTAEIQAITFNEFLPALLGNGSVDAYAGYDSTVDPGIANVFSGAAYRFGHSMLSSELLRLENDGSVSEEGNISLQNAFFSPDEITENGIDSLLLGAASQVANEVDNQVVDDIRNFLFGEPGSGGFDLASLNIQRGRDHGLADYNQAREDYGLERVTDFSEITSDAELAQTLEDLYGDVDNIDVWVGGLAEDHVDGSSVGELFSTIIVDQFERIRDGDRLWYQNVFSGQQLSAIENTSLADVIQRNTEITGLQDNIFFEAPEDQPIPADQFANDRHDRSMNPDFGHRTENGRNDPNRRDSQKQRTMMAPATMAQFNGNDVGQQDTSNARVEDNRNSSNRQTDRTRRMTQLDNAFAEFDQTENSDSV